MPSNPEAPTYQPTAEVYTSGGDLVMVTASDGNAKVELYLERREAYALAAAIERGADMSGLGGEYDTQVPVGP